MLTMLGNNSYHDGSAELWCTMTATNLFAFAVTSFAVVLVPGPSALFIIGRSLSLGRRGGVLSVIGDALGLLPQIVLVAIGVGAIIAASPILLLLVRLAGAGYLLLLGVQTIRRRRLGVVPDDAVGSTAEKARTARDPETILRQGFVVGITNPKSTVFFVAVLPQFIVPANGLVPVQMLILGGVFIFATLTVGTGIALIAGTAREWFVRTPERLAAVTGCGGALMILLALALIALALLPETR